MSHKLKPIVRLHSQSQKALRRSWFRPSGRDDCKIQQNLSLYKEGFRGFSALWEVFTQMGFFTTGQFRQITPVLSKVEWKVMITVHTCVPVPGIRSFSNQLEVKIRSFQGSAVTKQPGRSKKPAERNWSIWLLNGRWWFTGKGNKEDGNMVSF